MNITEAPALEVETIRADFPLLSRQVYDRSLIYFDNAATTQKPRQVLDRLASYYELENANVHRGVHFLSQTATDAYEAARLNIARFINAPSPRQVIFTRGTTESINLVASTFGRINLKAGDQVVVSAMEHHSNIVPWQMAAEAAGARLMVVPVTDAGELDMAELERLLTERVRLLALAHVSNTLGTINPIAEVIELAHRQGIPVLIDGAQAVAHLPVDVQALDADFYCFSGHKMVGPTGIGVLYGKADLLESMPPWQGGGDMIDVVTFERTTYNEIPHKFEAGTPNIGGVLGLSAAVDYLKGVGLDAIGAYEHQLLEYATDKILSIPGIRIYGTAAAKSAVVSFLIGSIHPYDAGTVLDRLGIAVRTGHHCTQPLMARFGIPGTVRASFAFYNTFDEIDALVSGLLRVKNMLT